DIASGVAGGGGECVVAAHVLEVRLLAKSRAQRSPAPIGSSAHGRIAPDRATPAHRVINSVSSCRLTLVAEESANTIAYPSLRTLAAWYLPRVAARSRQVAPWLWPGRTVPKTCAPAPSILPIRRAHSHQCCKLATRAALWSSVIVSKDKD